MTDINKMFRVDFIRRVQREFGAGASMRVLARRYRLGLLTVERMMRLYNK